MVDIALRRLHLIAVPAGDGLQPTHRAAWLAELASIGFRVTNPEQLRSTDPAMLADRAKLITTLTAMKGGDVEYVPLFTRFPDDVPDDHDLLTRRIVGYLGRVWGAWDQPPEWLFDLGDYGADPITQFQTEHATALGRLEQQRREADQHVEWTDVQLVTPDEAIVRVRNWLHDNLYAKSSIKEALRDDLRTVLTELGVDDVDNDRLVFRENRTFVARHLWLAGDLDALAGLRPTPTDLLRLFAALTDSDTSLASKMRFPKFTRGQRRFVLGCLELAPPARRGPAAVPGPVEDAGPLPAPDRVPTLVPAHGRGVRRAPQRTDPDVREPDPGAYHRW